MARTPRRSRVHHTGAARVPRRTAKRNVYRRTPCGFTVLRLLERNIITGEMRPVRHAELPTAEESRELVQKGLEALLGD